MAAFSNDQQSQSHQRPDFFLDSDGNYYLPTPTCSSGPTVPIERSPQQVKDLSTRSPSPTSSAISASSPSIHLGRCGLLQIEKDNRSCSISSGNKLLSEKPTMRRKRKNSKDGNRNGRNNCSQTNIANEGVRQEPEPPSGYIHVRARRGQATDSHSLAERVRREKISRRMKMLQSLVPGCDKVTGKALVLDEIINYIQSLQNQVEILSMKLSSLEPMACAYSQMICFHNDQDIQGKVENVPQLPFPQPTASNYPTIDMDPSLQIVQYGLLGQHSAFPELPQVDSDFGMLMDGTHECDLTALELENIRATVY